MREELEGLLGRIAAREPLDVGPEAVVSPASAEGQAMYRNAVPRLGIDFTVARLFGAAPEVLDPRVVLVAPGGATERHRHAHESLFVVLSGRGEVTVGERSFPVEAGDTAFVPRWAFHQTHNTGPEVMRVLAITDFGLTRAVLGDYDRRTRLADGGEDAG